MLFGPSIMLLGVFLFLSGSIATSIDPIANLPIVNRQTRNFERKTLTSLNRRISQMAILARELSTVLAGGTFPGPLIKGFKVRRSFSAQGGGDFCCNAKLIGPGKYPQILTTLSAVPCAEDTRTLMKEKVPPAWDKLCPIYDDLRPDQL
ncbi:hypothetical protein B0H19DRAFT_1061562 [Mycena capillaripes]|nr:hypothetical protein B0H19DRAFT_1061562 [Mycena capillaripes]